MISENAQDSIGCEDSSRVEQPKSKVLVVDDEEDVLRLIKDALEMEGIEVVTAFDGLSGLDAAERERPDVVVLDIMMPLMNGYEVCKQLRDNDRTSNIPVLFLSSAYTTDAVQTSKDLGAVGYIVKPFAPSELITAVKDVIESTRPDKS